MAKYHYKDRRPQRRRLPFKKILWCLAALMLLAYPFWEATTLTVCPDLIDMVEEEAKKIEGVKRTFREDKPAGSEDCTVLIKRVVDHGGKAAYFMFGCNHHGHHRADFEIQDETSMPIGFEVFCRMAKRLNGI